MKLDVLAFGAHPDDVEISCGGTLAKMIRQGYTVGIVDLTRGELGTRGNADLRDKEAAAAGEILGIHVRENLGMRDGFFQHSEENILKVIQSIRKYKPRILMANSIVDRHTDHGKGSSLVSEAAFLSGLRKIETSDSGKAQEAHRPEAVYYYIQDYRLEPDIIVDVSETMDVKMEAIAAFNSQFFSEASDEPETPISGKNFFDFLLGRAMDVGRPCGFRYGEGFQVKRPIGTDDLFKLR